ncbi:MAG: hypothetical protein K5663_08900 [Clostridiales bacterium]|nr:hypothetical protein [Clostridiales bacterium]
MKERFLLDSLEWKVERENAIKRLKVLADDFEDFDFVYNETLKRLRPVAYYGVERVESNDGHDVVIGGQSFHSRVVAVNLRDADTVYPYVITAGRAAYEYALGLDDELYRYWSDTISEMALKSYALSFNRYIKSVLGTNNVYTVAPGSVIDWHISAQRPLFDLLGEVFEKTGILLEKSFLMRPVKSGSGIMYISEKHFESCSLCAMDNCPNRKARFDKEKFDREYGE